MFSAHCESVSAPRRQTCSSRWCHPTPRPTQLALCDVWGRRGRKKPSRTSREHINHSCGSRVNVWILEFHLQHLLWDSKWQPGRDCGRSTCRILQRRSKTLLTQSRVSWLERYADYFYGSKRRIKKNKTNNQDSMKRLSCWTHCGHGHEGKRLLLLFLYQATTTGTFLFWRECSSGSHDPQAAQKQLPVLWFKAPLPAPLHTPQALDSFLCQEHRMLCPCNQAATVRARCSAPSASKHTHSCLRAKKNLTIIWRMRHCNNTLA